MLPYETASLKKSQEAHDLGFFPEIAVGEQLPFEACLAALDRKVELILKETGATDYCIYLSSPDIRTWRYEAATILPYKGNRENTQKPEFHPLLVENIKLAYKHKVVEFIEADDALSINQHKEIRRANSHDLDLSETYTVICSRDKDLNMVPGWHYSWGSRSKASTPMWLQTPLAGLKCFYKQLLTGDPVDNIKGLYGVGEKSKYVTCIDSMETEHEMLLHTYGLYKKYFGLYAEKFYKETGQLLWMMTSEHEVWDPWQSGLFHVAEGFFGEKQLHQQDS